MAKKVRVSRPAQRDLDEIWLFIAQDKPRTADRFVDYLIDRLPLLAASPRMGRSRDDLSPGLRGFPVKNYMILYRVSADRLEIVRVVHGARDLRALFR